MFDLGLLAIGLGFLIKGADMLVSGASALARRLGMSELAAGLTLVAFGTSAPEFFVSVLAGIQGNADIALANVVGSNIFNILFILGVCGLIFPFRVSRGTVWKEIPFSLLAALILTVLANDVFLDRAAGSALGRSDGIVLLAFFSIFLYYTAGLAPVVDPTCGQPSNPCPRVGRNLLLVAVGLFGLAIGGKLVVDSAVRIASAAGLSRTFIGLTLVAAGTSLPELATSAVAAWRGKGDIAAGNVIGSNIFNVFFILGLSSLINPLSVPLSVQADLVVLILASLFLFLIMFTGVRRQLDRWEAVLFLCAYVGYIVFALIRGRLI